jgi:pyruvate-formate lyase-activating enzyme
MRIQTLSLIAGSKACNACCPYCVSRMTGKEGMVENQTINRRNLQKACTLAKQSGTTTAMITGKGEPMLDTQMIMDYLVTLDNAFPFIELQTNGLLLNTDSGLEALRQFYLLGLNTVAISIVSSKPKDNHRIFLGNSDREYPVLSELINNVHEIGLMVRLTCTMIRGYVDSWGLVDNLISFCEYADVEQLALAPVRHPYNSRDGVALGWVDANEVPPSAINGIRKGLQANGHKLMDLMHGAEVFDVNGVSVCLRDCLTLEPNTDEIRQLIFYPDGRLMYDWQYEGAVLL